jgi:hypothetical protein
MDDAVGQPRLLPQLGDQVAQVLRRGGVVPVEDLGDDARRGGQRRVVGRPRAARFHGARD